MSGKFRLVRAVRRLLLTIAGIIGAMFCYAVCQSVFAHYPQYGTNILSYIGLGLIVATGGVAWITDHRRIRDDD